MIRSISNTGQTIASIVRIVRRVAALVSHSGASSGLIVVVICDVAGRVGLIVVEADERKIWMSQFVDSSKNIIRKQRRAT